jgi:hypothetical protein
VVHHPQARETRLVGGSADLGQFGAYPRCALRPGETRDLQAYAHVAISSRVDQLQTGRFYPLNGTDEKNASFL